MKMGTVQMVSKRAMALAMLAIAGTAAAQISAPPTQAPAPTPEFVPPPPAPPGPPAGAPNTQPERRNPIQTIPDMPIEPPLRSADGKLIKLEQPLFWQAMRHNVSLTESVKTSSKPFLERRVRKYEKIVTDNADLMRQINEGVIDKAELLPQRAGNKEKDEGRAAINKGANGGLGLSALMQVLKPLVGDNVREEFQKSGIMTRIQAGQNSKIMQRYAAEASTDFEKSLPKLADDATDDDKKKRKETLDRERMRQQMYLWVDESVFAYNGLLNDGGEKIDDTLKAAKVDAGPIADEVKAVKAASDRDARVAAMKKLVLKLTVEQERAILQAVRDTRPDLGEEPEPAKPAEPAGEATKAEQ